MPKREPVALYPDPHDICRCEAYRKDHGSTNNGNDGGACGTFRLMLSANGGWEDSCQICADALRMEHER
jgi:hypothetical protein